MAPIALARTPLAVRASSAAPRSSLRALPLRAAAPRVGLTARCVFFFLRADVGLRTRRGTPATDPIPSAR